MKILVMAVVLAISAAAKQPAKKSTAKAAQQPAPKPKPAAEPLKNAPPKDAKKIDETHWRWVDPKTGKAWIYYFGGMSWIKRPEESVNLEKAEKPEVNVIKAVDQGETVAFTRTTVMGLTRWSKKKSELSAEEQAALDAAQQEKK